MKYDKLSPSADVDHEKVRQLAALYEEMDGLEARLAHLKRLARRHKKLNDYVWRTKTGRYMLIHDMDDDHLKNAVRFSMERRGNVPEVVLAEYTKRFGEVMPEAKDTGAGNLLSESRHVIVRDDMF